MIGERGAGGHWGKMSILAFNFFCADIETTCPGSIKSVFIYLQLTIPSSGQLLKVGPQTKIQNIQDNYLNQIV